jgi:CRISPR-associated protein Cas5d
MGPNIRIRVAGRFACFTRPEAKVERFTYPVMTPSAARNVLDSICWRPQMRWIVTRISVLKPIRTMSVLRNEVQSKLSPVAVKKWMRDPAQFEPLIAGAGVGSDGTPRNTTLLRDVAYWIDAYPHVFDTSGDNTPEKYVAMMQRRAERGQCFQRPYLGCREFAAEFSPPHPEDKPIQESMEIGRMLYDIAFLPDGNRAAFFNARLVNGVLETHPDSAIPDENRRRELLCWSHTASVAPAETRTQEGD